MKEGVGCERSCTRYGRKVVEEVRGCTPTYIHVSKHTHMREYVCTHEYTAIGPKRRAWPEGSKAVALNVPMASGRGAVEIAP